MLQAAATDLTKVIMESVKTMVDAEVKRQLGSAVPVPRSAEVTVVLWSSEIAAYLGDDAWLSRPQILAKVWKRSHEGSYRDAHDKWLLRGKKPLRLTNKQILSEGLGEMLAASTCSTKQSTDPYLKVQTSEDVERFRKDHSQKEVLKLYRTKGKLLEEETSQLFAESINQPVSLRNAAVLWDPSLNAGELRQDPSVRPLGPILTPGPYVITGEMDACLTSPPFVNTPVEFKLRMSGIPSSVPFRDIVQLHSYMAMMGSKKGFLVQRAFGSAAVDTTILDWDEELWCGKILPAVETIVCDVRKLLRGSLADEELRHQVFSSSETAAPTTPTVNIRKPPSVTMTLVKTTTSKKRKKNALPEIKMSYNLRARRTI